MGLRHGIGFFSVAIYLPPKASQEVDKGGALCEVAGLLSMEPGSTLSGALATPENTSTFEQSVVESRKQSARSRRPGEMKPRFGPQHSRNPLRWNR